MSQVCASAQLKAWSGHQVNPSFFRQSSGVDTDQKLANMAGLEALSNVLVCNIRTTSPKLS
jgi:hypothetical protein